MGVLLVFLLFLSLAAVQSAVGIMMGTLPALPNGILVMVVSGALIWGSDVGMLWGFLGGLALGLLSSAPLGMHALLLVIVGYLAGLGRHHPFQSRFIIPVLVTAGSTLLYGTGMGVLLRWAGWSLPLSLGHLTRVIAPAVIANSLLLPFVYWPLMHWAERRGGAVREL